MTILKHHVSNDGHNNEYKHQGFEHDGISEHEGLVYHNMRTADGASTPPQLIYHKESGEYVHPNLFTHIPPPFTSAPPLPQPGVMPATSNTFCCRCHKGEVYIMLQDITSILILGRYFQVK